MKTYSTEQIKNIFLIGNSGSGKTTLAETMAFNGGLVERRGDINSKNTISDFKDEGLISIVDNDIVINSVENLERLRF